MTQRHVHRAEAGNAAGLRWTCHGHRGSVDACAVSADGMLVASGGEDAAVRVWDAFSGALLWTLGEPEDVAPVPADPTSIAREAAVRLMGRGADMRAVGFSHDNRYLAHVWSEFVTLWNLTESAAWDPSGREQLACVSWIYGEGPGHEEGWAQACRVNEAEDHLRVWFALPSDEVVWADFEREDGCLVELGHPVSGTRHIAFRPDGGSVVTIAPPAVLSVGAVPESMKTLTAGAIALNAHDRSHGLDTRGVVFSVGNTHGLFGQGGVAHVASMTEFPPRRHAISLDGAIAAAAVARDCPLGVTACIGARAQSVVVWDLERREPVRKLPVEDVTDCGISADGRVLVTSSGSPFVRTAAAQGLVQIWDL